MSTSMGANDISASGNITAGGNVSGANLASGTFTPTGAGIANVASVTPAAAQWMRVGNVVTVSGNVAVDPTSTGTLTALSFFDNYASSSAGGKPVAPVWFTSPDRVEVSSLAFMPGQPEIAQGKLNIWRGFALEPHSNDALVKELRSWSDSTLTRWACCKRF